MTIAVANPFTYESVTVANLVGVYLGGPNKRKSNNRRLKPTQATAVWPRLRAAMAPRMAHFNGTQSAHRAAVGGYAYYIDRTISKTFGAGAWPAQCAQPLELFSGLALSVVITELTRLGYRPD